MSFLVERGDTVQQEQKRSIENREQRLGSVVGRVEGEVCQSLQCNNVSTQSLIESMRTMR